MKHPYVRSSRSFSTHAYNRKSKDFITRKKIKNLINCNDCFNKATERERLCERKKK